MTLFRPLAALLVLALAACATTAGEPAAPSWYVMRHLQKAEGPDPALSEEGRRNAERLIARLVKDPPAAIYVSATRRARETAGPLAAKLGLTPREYDPRDTPALVARAKAETGTVLIVGHSNTVPEIVAGLGGARPADLAETDYGDIFRVRRDGTVERLRLY
ncbi:MAG TPA: phosphoglycerate mutase family protein [Allosphingosinicella sp.]|jgi:phosphohistidine phosphatase SixA|nr:phosphoglycerate mutase family protein [Allosphingosinicella sp.]